MRVNASAPRGKSLRERVSSLTLKSVDDEEREDLQVLLACLLKNGGSFVLVAAAKQFLGLPAGPHETNELVMQFDVKEDRGEFLGWFMDGGGEYQYNESREAHGMKRLKVDMVRFGVGPVEDQPDERRIEALVLKPYEDG